MNTTDLYPRQPTPAGAADWSDAAGLQAKMIACIEELSAMSGNVGTSKTVLEFSSDRRKRALARAAAAALIGGESAANAELEARGSESYGKELDQLMKEHAAAEQIGMEWDALKLKWQTAQSLLAMMREEIKRV
jgi:hypothetical protein